MNWRLVNDPYIPKRTSGYLCGVHNNIREYMETILGYEGVHCRLNILQVLYVVSTMKLNNNKKKYLC